MCGEDFHNGKIIHSAGGIVVVGGRFHGIRILQGRQFNWTSSVSFVLLARVTIIRRCMPLRPSLNLNVNCRTLICRLFKGIILILLGLGWLYSKRLLIQPCTYHKLEFVFHCLLLLFLTLVLNFKIYMSMNMNISREIS